MGVGLVLVLMVIGQDSDTAWNMRKGLRHGQGFRYAIGVGLSLGLVIKTQKQP